MPWMAQMEARTNETTTGNEHAEMIAALGASVRTMRKRRGMTLEDLASLTGVSSSMISLVERGKSSPSIGTLLAIASGIGVPVGELFPNLPVLENHIVTRLDEQPIVEKNPGYSRRLLRLDRPNQTEFSMLTFAPGAFNHKGPSGHRGHEYGVVIDGELTVQFRSTRHTLRSGDAISFLSSDSHRIVNESDRPAVAVWINVG